MRLKATIPCYYVKKNALKNVWDSELLHCLAENYTDSLTMREVVTVMKKKNPLQYATQDQAVE